MAMGNDEHGPAYPDHDPANVKPFHDHIRRVSGYRCPICGGNQDRYLECEYPGCPDGRDQSRLRPAHWFGPDLSKPTPPRGIALMGWAVAIALGLWAFWPRPAPALDHGFNPNNATVKWMESLQRPNEPGSCCGKGDGYPVSDYWDNGDGTWTAVIGDGSAMVYPDGTSRHYVTTGEHIIVPRDLVNHIEDDLDNPTDTSWIFMTVYDSGIGTLYCLIRHPSGN